MVSGDSNSDHDSTKRTTETSQNHGLLRLHLLTLGIRRAFQGLARRRLRADTLDALHALRARLNIDRSLGLRCLSILEGL